MTLLNSTMTSPPPSTLSWELIGDLALITTGVMLPIIPGTLVIIIPGIITTGPGIPMTIGVGAGASQISTTLGGMDPVCGVGIIGDLVPGLTGLMDIGLAGMA